MNDVSDSLDKGWTVDQLFWALSPVPADYHCDDETCDCQDQIKVWRKLRRALGIFTDQVGRA